MKLYSRLKQATRSIVLIFAIRACIGPNFLLAEPNRLHNLTVASRPTVTLQQLQDSCDFSSIKLDVYGMGLPYLGNGQKLTYIQKYIETIPYDEIVLFTDAYDCLILGTESAIVEKFLNFCAPIVISTETDFWPPSHLHLKDLVPPSPTKFKYINSGAIIGRAGKLREMLEAMSPINECMSDQGQLWEYFLNHQNEVILDVHCQLFISLNNLKENEIYIDAVGKRVFNLNTLTIPLIIHGNGHGKGLYQKIYDALFK